MSLLDLTRELCRDLTGSQCNAPRMSSWRLVDPSQINLGADVADLASFGASALFPINAKMYGSYFTTGLERNSPIVEDIRIYRAPSS